MAEAGDDLTSAVDDRAVVIGNHQSTGDVPSLFYALQNKGSVINNIMWIQDVLFKLTDFGWVSMVHGDFFIQQVASCSFAYNFANTFDDTSEIIKAFIVSVKSKLPILVRLSPSFKLA